MASWTPRWLPTNKPIAALREAACAYEAEIIQHLRRPDGTKHQSSTYVQARRGLEAFVNGCESYGWLPKDLPPNFWGDVWLAHVGRPATRIEGVRAASRLTSARRFVEYLREKGWEVAPLDTFRINTSALPSKAATTPTADDAVEAVPPVVRRRGHLGVVDSAQITAAPPPESAAEPAAIASDPAANLDAAEAEIAESLLGRDDPEPPRVVLPRTQPAKARSAPRRPASRPAAKEPKMPPRPTGNPLASKMPSGYALQAWIDRPGLEPLYVGEWPAEQVNAQTSIPAFFRASAIPAIPAHLRRGLGAEVKFLAYHLNPNGQAEGTESYTLPVPGEWLVPVAPTAGVPVVAAAPAPASETAAERLVATLMAQNQQLANQISELQRAALAPRPPVVVPPTYPPPPPPQIPYADDPPPPPSITDELAKVAVEAARAQFSGRPMQAAAAEPRAERSDLDEVARLERTASLVDRLRGNNGSAAEQAFRRELDDVRATLSAIAAKLTAPPPSAPPPPDPAVALTAQLQQMQTLGNLMGVDFKPRRDGASENISSKIGDAILELVRKAPEIMDKVATVQRQNAGIFETPAGATPEQQAEAERKREAFEAQVRAQIPAGLRNALDALANATTVVQVRDGISALASALESAQSGPHASAFGEVQKQLVQILDAREATFAQRPADAQTRLAQIDQAMFKLLSATMIKIGYRKQITQKQLVFVIRSWWSLMDAERAEKEQREAEEVARAAREEAEQQAMVARLQQQAAASAQAQAASAPSSAPAAPAPAPAAAEVSTPPDTLAAPAGLNGLEPAAIPNGAADLSPEQRAAILRDVDPFARVRA